MAMPLSEELWRPTSCSCRGRSGRGGGLEAPGAASPRARAEAGSPGPSCEALAEDEDVSGHAASRLLALTSEWLASDEELDRLRSSPGPEGEALGAAAGTSPAASLPTRGGAPSPLAGHREPGGNGEGGGGGGAGARRSRRPARPPPPSPRRYLRCPAGRRGTGG